MGILFRIVTPFFVDFKSDLLEFIFTLLCVFAGIFVGYFSYWIGKSSLINTILDIGKFSNKLSEGDFTSKLVINSKDEIGDFVNNYNSLIQILKESIQTIQELSIESNSSMQEQKIATNELTINTQNLSEKYDLINSETEHNSKNLDYVSTHFNILCFSIESLMVQIEKLAHAIHEIKEASDRSIEKTIIIEKKIQSIEDNLTNAKLSMDKISTSSSEISKIITIIQSFSDKINLLALNAAIESARAGEEGKGFRYILSGMNAERILIAAECIGDAKWFINKATDYAKDRQVFGRAIGQNQGVQFPIARCYAQMCAAELMVHHAAKTYDAGGNPGAEANMAKLLASEASWAAADMCVQTFGGFGFAEEYDVERKFREARLYTVAPISTNLILSYLAEHVLGLPRSY